MPLKHHSAYICYIASLGSANYQHPECFGFIYYYFHPPRLLLQYLPCLRSALLKSTYGEKEVSVFFFIVSVFPLLHQK